MNEQFLKIENYIIAVNAIQLITFFTDPTSEGEKARIYLIDKSIPVHTEKAAERLRVFCESYGLFALD